MKKQKSFFPRGQMAYGGDLLTKRRARQSGRPLSTHHSMHLVLRSTKAVGDWSFRKSKNRSRVDGILKGFAKKYGIRVLSSANVGNHIHIHMQLTSRHTYKPFIRAVTAAIAMAVTGVSRWNLKLASIADGKLAKFRFWDRRPFTRIVLGRKGYLNVRDYVEINQYEAFYGDRNAGKYYLELDKLQVAWRSTG